MKKLSILFAFFTVLFISCEGDPGPAGFDGADGLIGSIFETDITFNSDNGFEGTVDIPTSINVLNTDVVIAFVLNGDDNGADVWEPLPQTLFLGNDILLYGFDYTVSNVRFFLDGTLDFTTLDSLFTDNVTFRIAVIPADAAANIDTSNFNEVMSVVDIEEIKKVQ